MQLTGNDAREVVWEDTENWKAVTDETMIDQRRWVTVFSRIFEHVSTHTYYEFIWERGSTESQEQDPFEYDEFYEPVEVVEQEVLVTQWVPKSSVQAT